MISISWQAIVLGGSVGLALPFAVYLLLKIRF
ncbi:hypothetical protein SAMN05421809_3619 [Natronorubrum daqingense]|uniref:Uncharacterized protein n=1 Tax=Natronorubrum daqingense TaxID=588898 RepID=A0A1N7FZV7_9EURY|nr:hypothetical protein SAMN05421809_3619 [Natronorubrum daqingense]